MQPFENIYRPLTEKIMTLECGNSIVLFDTEDYPSVSKKQWSVGTHGYVTSGAGADQVLMHRFIMNLSDTGMSIDHINRNKTDNRKSNLRICSVAENSRNRTSQSNSKTGMKGVCKIADGRFQSQIVIDGKPLYLGIYSSAEEAARVYDTVHTLTSGGFACPNIEATIDPEILKRIQEIKRRRRLSESDMNEIRRLRANGLSISEISRKIGCSRSSVGRFLNGLTYGGKVNA